MKSFVVSLSLLLMATYILIEIVERSGNSFVTLMSVVAYIVLVPTTMVVATLWSEVRASLTQVFKLRKPVRERRLLPLHLYSDALYAISSFISIPKYQDLVASLILEAGVALDPRVVSSLAAICSPCVGLVGFFVLSRFFSFVQSVMISAVLSLTVFVLPIAVLSFLRSARRSGIEVELPFFLVYSTIVERAGRGLVTAFERISQQRQLFKALSREALILRKIRMFFKLSPVDALEEYVQHVPSEKLRTMITSYISVLRIGGNTVAVLEDSYRMELEDMVARWKRYVETANFLSDVLVAMFTLFPTIVILGAIAFSSSMSLFVLDTMIYILTPVIGAGLYVFVDMLQPKIPRIPLFMGLDIVIAGSGFVISLILAFVLIPRMGFLKSLPLVLALGMVPELAMYIARSVEVKAVEKGLPKLLRDIAEFLRFGYGVSQAIIRIANVRSYNKFLDRYVKALATLMNLNVPLERIYQSFYTRSWVFNFVLFVLSDLEKLGALTPHEVEALGEFLERVRETAEHSRRSLTLYVVLSLATPLMLLGITYMCTSLILQSKVLKSLALSGVELISFGIVDLVVERSKLLSIAVAMMMGILAAKIRDGTGLNTLYAVLALILVELALVALF